MQKYKSILALLVLFITGIISFVSSSFTVSDSKIHPSLFNTIQPSNDNSGILVWIYFSDKGENIDYKINNPDLYLTDRAIERRIKRLKNHNLIEYSDIPVNKDYIQELIISGIKIRHVSKWFNSVSCFANRNQIEAAAGKHFIKKIEPVVKYRKNIPPQTDNEVINQFEKSGVNKSASINYGPSLNQCDLISVPQVHDRGYAGQGVLIASFDSGFDNLEHNCFIKIREKGLRTYDFVNGDTIVANGEGRLGNGAHGTITLSLISGYDPGNLVSPAFESHYILAKTENTESETPLEEDNWVAAAEWADSLGADVITSSLGYLGFEEPYISYTWQSMNGNTALITRAADIAVSKGIVVVVSAGNDGLNTSHNTLNAPADGFNVLTVGSVTLNRFRSSFSSVGPTYDGRIKPDVMALGHFNYCARSGSGNQGYTSSNTGTSLACPMVAGVCAIILSAKPELSPLEISNLLRSTADSSVHPNNYRGWGLINADFALRSALNEGITSPDNFILLQNFPNPFNPETNFKFSLKKDADVSLVLFDISGREILKIIDNVFFNAGTRQFRYNFSKTGLSSGVYIYTMKANGQYSGSKKLVLLK